MKKRKRVEELQSEDVRKCGTVVESSENFADWLIVLAKSIKAQADLCMRSDMELRREMARAIEQKFTDFNKVTRIFEEWDRQKLKLD
jgi:hypothetical protein